MFRPKVKNDGRIGTTITGQSVYIFEEISDLNLENITGFIEQWYFGNVNWYGTKIYDVNKLDYAENLARSQGLPLGNIGFYTIDNQKEFYSETSFLINNSILTLYYKKMYSGKEKLHIDKQIPERILSILAKTQDGVRKTSKMLKLPLEDCV